MNLSATGTLRLNPSRAFAAFGEWSALMSLRGQSLPRQLRRLMRFWISIAIRKLKDKGIDGQPGKIQSDLMRLSNGGVNWQGKSRGKRQQALRGTIAAALVLALNWQGARTAATKSGASAFYGKVGRFISARVFSRGIHKAGFYPVLAALKGAGDLGRIPRYRNLPGSYTESFDDAAATLIAENYASAAARPHGRAALGIAGLAPDILSDAEQDVAALLCTWLAQDMEAAWGRIAS